MKIENVDAEEGKDACCGILGHTLKLKAGLIKSTVDQGTDPATS